MLEGWYVNQEWIWEKVIMIESVGVNLYEYVDDDHGDDAIEKRRIVCFASTAA